MWTELNNRFSSHFLPPADSHLIFAIIARLSTLIIYYTLCCIVGNSQGNFEINQRSAKHRQERGKTVTRTYEFLPSLLSVCRTNDDLLLNTHFSHIWLVYKKLLFVSLLSKESLVFTIRDWDITELSSRLGWELFNYLHKCLKHVNTPP